MNDDKEYKESETAVKGFEGVLPLVALRGKVITPKSVFSLDVARPRSVAAVNYAIERKTNVFLSAQKNEFEDFPKARDINEVGVVATIKQIIRLPAGMTKVSFEAIFRARAEEFSEGSEFTEAKVKQLFYIDGASESEEQAYLHILRKSLDAYLTMGKIPSKDLYAMLDGVHTADEYIDLVFSFLGIRESYAQEIINENETGKRVLLFKRIFDHETEIMQLEKKITARVRTDMDKNQKEFYLREQLKAIHTELGDGENEITEMTESLKAKNLPKEVFDKAMKEISRLEKINSSSPDYSIILNYLDWLKDLPFGVETKDTEDLKKAKAVLDKDHFGLEKVKERIVEYLAVLHLTKEIRGPILCFVGPPGVGKTSVAASIARALGRKFVRMSLGGVGDEAEIRGHRKTYVGAMPGRIINGLKVAGSSNPVFLLDEIDKLSSSVHGDPAGALLEVLDPEQNNTFRDRYLEVPFDLSKVMFITTANTVDTIPYPLLDRMEIIELNGYTNEEKKEIAKRYLIPKQLKLNGVDKGKAQITDSAVAAIISDYTMEAGVRGLEREIGAVVRKIAVAVASEADFKKRTVSAKNIKDYLGVGKFAHDRVLEKDEVGACTGLAWTSFGGTTLTIEVSLMKGKGEIILTGKLGDVMKESAHAAISYIRANAARYGINDDVFEKTDIHIHVPEGATPKDGPSAGITMATAILSAFTGKTVKKSVAMTGEITLRGKVLPIGGLKEKALAAYRMGIKEVIIPADNQKDLDEIPETVREGVKFLAAGNIGEVFAAAINF